MLSIIGEKVMNKKIIIYDPPMCCSFGICGPNQNQTLIDFQDTFTKLKQSGHNIERFIITKSPEKFKENPQVIKLIQEQQLKVLPITTVDGVIVKTGSYPTGKELEGYLIIKGNQMKNKFFCQHCQEIFETKGKKVKYRDPIFGPCWERIAKCLICDAECREYRQKNSAKKDTNFDDYVDSLRNQGGGGCNLEGGCCG